MKSFTDLPKGYEIIHSIDAVQDKKEAWILNIISLGLLIFTFVIGNFIYPITRLFSRLSNLKVTQIKTLWVNLAIMIVLLLGFILLREGVKSIFIKIFCKESKLNFSYYVIYACVSSDVYYSKGAYMMIALAPLTILGTVLILINFCVPQEYFWTVFVIQMLNVCSSASDLCFSAFMIRLPKDICVFDNGRSMKIYANKSE